MIEASEELRRRSARDIAVPREEAGFTALLPCRGLPRFTPADFLRTLNGILDDAGAGAELVHDLTHFEQSPGGTRIWHRQKAPPRLGATVAGITLVVEGQDRPAFSAGDAGALQCRSWPTGAREIARARGHLRVREAVPAPDSDLDLNHDRALALTVAAAAVAELGQATGVVWETSGVAVPACDVLAAMPSLMGGEPPVALWIGTRAGRGGVVTTRGLFPLLGAEVELRAPGVATAEAERVVLGLAAEILETGRPPAEGTRIAHRQRPGFLVRYRGGDDDAAPAIVLEETGGAGLAAGVA